MAPPVVLVFSFFLVWNVYYAAGTTCNDRRSWYNTAGGAMSSPIADPGQSPGSRWRRPGNPKESVS